VGISCERCVPHFIENRYRRKFGNGFARADVTDVTDVRKKEEGRRKKEERRRKKEEGKMLI